MTRNSFLISLTLLSRQKMKSVLSILSFLSLNTWITNHDRKDYKEQQVGGLQKGRLQSAIDFGLLSVTEWVRKCDMDCKVWQDDLQSVTGITKCKRITKGNGTMTPIYIHCLTVHLKYFMKKVILMIGTILSEYIIADIIRDIFRYTFLINVVLNVLQCHTNENSSFMNS